MQGVGWLSPQIGSSEEGSRRRCSLNRKAGEVTLCGYLQNRFPEEQQVQRPWGVTMPGTSKELQRGLWGWGRHRGAQGEVSPWQHMGILSCTSLAPSFQSICSLITLPILHFSFLFFPPLQDWPIQSSHQHAWSQRSS